MKQTLAILVIVALISCKGKKKEDAPIWLFNHYMPMEEIKPYNDTVEAAVLTMNKNKAFYWKHVYMARHYNGAYYELNNVLNLKKKPINIQVFETHYKQR